MCYNLILFFLAILGGSIKSFAGVVGLFYFFYEIRTRKSSSNYCNCRVFYQLQLLVWVIEFEMNFLKNKRDFLVFVMFGNILIDLRQIRYISQVVDNNYYYLILKKEIKNNCKEGILIEIKVNNYEVGFFQNIVLCVMILIVVIVDRQSILLF